MAYNRTSPEEMEKRTAKVKALIDAGYKNKEIIDELGITYYQLITSLRKLGIYQDRVDERDRSKNNDIVVDTVASYLEAKLYIGETGKEEKYTDKDGKKYVDVSSFYGL